MAASPERFCSKTPREEHPGGRTLLAGHGCAPGMSGAGAGGVDRVVRTIYRRVYRERSLIEGSLPREYRRLEELVREERPSVELVGGGEHVLRRDDVERLWETLPWYLRPFARLPLVFTYRRLGGLQVYELRGPDKWAARIVHYLLYGSLAGEAWRLRYSEIRELMDKFPSLILVVIDASL